jgi:hypothetical protein
MTEQKRNIIEFATVAMEFCKFAQAVTQTSPHNFIDTGCKLLPLLYIKASLLPSQDTDKDAWLEEGVTEDMYESVRSEIAAMLGEHDSYLETFNPDMPYSDTPLAAFISESIADVYQDVGNFCLQLQQWEGNDEVARQAVEICSEAFRNYWGKQLLSALKALHSLRYNEEIIFE